MILPADINSWDDEYYFLWKERASIMLYEGNPEWITKDEKSAIFARARQTAEYLAEQDIRKLVRTEGERNVR